MTQFARPAADQATGTWVTTPLWSKVDEGAPGDDTDITSADNTSPDDAVFTTTIVGDPGVHTGHVLRAAWHKSAAGGHSIDAVLRLYQGDPGAGGTLIATLSVVGIGETEQTDTATLTEVQAGNITDYAGLYLLLRRAGDTGGNPNGRRSLVVDFVELELPDAVLRESGEISEAVSLAGSQSGAAQTLGAVADALALAGGQAGKAAGFGSVAEAVSLADEFLGSTAGAFTGEIEEALSLTDGISAGAMAGAAVEGALSLSETLAALARAAAGIDTGIALGDALSAGAMSGASFGGEWTLSDGFSIPGESAPVNRRRRAPILVGDYDRHPLAVVLPEIR